LSPAELGEAADLALRLGEPARAARLYGRAVESSTTVEERIRLASLRAQLLAQHGRGPEALETLERAARRDRGQPALLVQLGRLATQAQRYGRAERALREALERATEPRLRALAASALADLAIQSGDAPLGREALAQLADLPVEPAARTRLDETIRGLSHERLSWD
jgi:uncharacterized protein HemY